METEKYYIAVNKSTDHYFTWEQDESYNIIGSTTPNIDEAVRYADKDSLISILGVSQKIDRYNFVIISINE